MGLDAPRNSTDEEMEEYALSRATERAAAPQTLEEFNGVVSRILTALNEMKQHEEGDVILVEGKAYTCMDPEFIPEFEEAINTKIKLMNAGQYDPKAFMGLGRIMDDIRGGREQFKRIDDDLTAMEEFDLSRQLNAN